MARRPRRVRRAADKAGIEHKLVLPFQSASMKKFVNVVPNTTSPVESLTLCVNEVPSVTVLGTSKLSGTPLA